MSDDTQKILAAQRVKCPRCGAKPNRKCVRSHPASYKPGTEMGVFHQARYAAVGVNIVNTGCGEIGPLGEACVEHVREVEFDGFTQNWHVAPNPQGRSMWRNGPSMRANEPEFVHRIAGGEDTLAELQAIIDARKNSR